MNFMYNFSTFLYKSNVYKKNEMIVENGGGWLKDETMWKLFLCFLQEKYTPVLIHVLQCFDRYFIDFGAFEAPQLILNQNLNLVDRQRTKDWISLT